MTIIFEKKKDYSESAGALPVNVKMTRLEAKLALFACRSLNLRKCPSKKPTEQDFVSTLPNLDALRDDKGDAASRQTANLALKESQRDQTKTHVLPYTQYTLTSSTF
ncbi:unnamed protein product [Colias eurytheme]|nr:unnamed protein product [Colias eurytheme]